VTEGVTIAHLGEDERVRAGEHRIRITPDQPGHRNAMGQRCHQRRAACRDTVGERQQQQVARAQRVRQGDRIQMTERANVDVRRQRKLRR